MAMINDEGKKRGSGWLTLKEAAILANISEKKIRHELSEKIIVPRLASKDTTRWYFTPREVFYFCLLGALHELPFQLSHKHKRDLYWVIAYRKHEKGIWRWQEGQLCLKGRLGAQLWTSELRQDLVERIRVLRRGTRRIVTRPEVLGGEPTFEGTRISVRHVGELVNREIPLAELREDFPSLSDEDFKFAGIFAKLGRPPGRPRSPLRFKHERGEVPH